MNSSDLLILLSKGLLFFVILVIIVLMSVLAVRTHWYVLLPTFLWPEVIPTHTSHFPAVKLGPYSEFDISLPRIHFCLSDRQYFPTRPDASIWRYYHMESSVGTVFGSVCESVFATRLPTAGLSPLAFPPVQAHSNALNSLYIE